MDAPEVAYHEILRRLDEHDGRLSVLERMETMAGETEEVTAEIAGQKVSLKSLSLNTLLTLAGVIGVVAISVLTWTHLQDSKDASQAMLGAIRELTTAQKDQTVVARELNCLLSLPLERRDPELCRRIAR